MTDSLSTLSPVPCPLAFRLRNDVALEVFGDRALVLSCGSLRLREVNARMRDLLLRLPPKSRTAEVLAAELGWPAGEVMEALLEMEGQGVVCRMVKLTMERPTNMETARYLVNPDVSFRQEGDDGGILFNPDTDTLEAINPTAVAIWQFLAAPRTPAEVTAHLCEFCDEAAPDQVAADVKAFLDSMREKGFVGVVEEDA